jgi:hypothetical protein
VGGGEAEDIRRAREELWELAQKASRYLRRHASPAVRLAAALLLAASLAACNASTSDPAAVEAPAVAPLQQEVSTGLPRGPGTYSVVPGSVFRDQRGVYQFEWLESGSKTGPGRVAHVSRLRLVRAETLELELPAVANATGGEIGDPVLHLPENEDINLIQEAKVGATQPGPQYYPPTYSYWNPFLVGMLMGGMRPGYYDPPRTIVVQQPAGTTGSGTIPRVTGGSASDTAKPPTQRITGVQTAVSGRAGGTGTGSAVTNRNPTTGSSAARAGSSVSAPRSGGFSGGTGSIGGSSTS